MDAGRVIGRDHAADRYSLTDRYRADIQQPVRRGHGAVTYGLLLSVAYRAFVREEASWDLLALVIVSGGVATMYQGRHRVLSRPWLIMTLMAIAMALLLAASLVLLRRL
jgi:hypothetical protein